MATTPITSFERKGAIMTTGNISSFPTIIQYQQQQQHQTSRKTLIKPEQVIFYAPPAASLTTTITAVIPTVNYSEKYKTEVTSEKHQHQLKTSSLNQLSFHNLSSTQSTNNNNNNNNSIYRERSIEETEAAHDLLSLSQSLPPLPAPCVVTILQPSNDINRNIITHSSHHTNNNNNHSITTVMQEISNSNHKQPTECLINRNSAYDVSYHIIPDVHALPPVKKIRYNSYESNTENCSPLTPPNSEHSSDIEIDISSSASESSSSFSPSFGSSSAGSCPTSFNSTSNQQKIRPNDDLWNPELLRIKTKNKSGNIINEESNDRSSTSLEGLLKKDSPNYNNHSHSNGSSKTKSGSYKCVLCGKQYATSSNLSRHKQTHRSLDSQSAKKCNTCGKAYVSMPALAMHLLTHKLTHSCDICGKLFSRPWLLQGHLRSHTGEKPYSCSYCNKAFADRSNLRAHMQTHSSEKSFECNKCHKTFALKSYLNKHLESACMKDRDSNMGSSDDNDEDIIVT